MNYLIEIFNALWNLLVWCCAGGVLALGTAWFACKFSDWVQACHYDWRKRQEEGARQAWEQFKRSQDEAREHYAQPVLKKSGWVERAEKAGAN